MTKPTFRLATTSDLDQLVELRLLMQKEVNSPEQIASDYAQSLRNYFDSNLSNGSYLSAVAEVDSQLVSANGLVIYSKPPSVNGGTGRMGYISNVYTRPEWRGHGFAHSLIKVLIEHARSNHIDKLHLGTTELGKGVYERAGFTTPRFPHLELKL